MGVIVHSNNPTPSQVLIGKELEDKFRAAEAKLTPQERELIQLRRDWSTSHKAAAEILGMKSPDAATMALARSLLKLSSLLIEEGVEQ